MIKNLQHFTPLWGRVEHSPRAGLQGFTLAEVLITLGIIGIVAALTIPTLVVNNQEKGWDTAANVFNRKLGEALRVMNVQATLANHNTTQEFVDELSRHIKIVKVCDSENLNECFVKEFSTNDNTYKTEELKQAKNLNKKGNYGTETLGVQFADGVSALIAYNKNAKQDPFNNNTMKDAVVGITSSGEGKDRTIGLSTDALAILYDVSGNTNPNTYGTNDKGKFKDIRGINVDIKVGADILDLGKNYSTINCSDKASEDYKYCGRFFTSGIIEYWAGAQKACDEQGMKLPTIEELKTLYTKKGEEGIPTQGNYWSSTATSSGFASYLSFTSGNSTPENKSTKLNVLCVAN